MCSEYGEGKKNLKKKAARPQEFSKQKYIQINKKVVNEKIENKKNV